MSKSEVAKEYERVVARYKRSLRTHIDEVLEVPYVLQLGVNRSPSTQGRAMLKLEAVKDLRKVAAERCHVRKQFDEVREQSD
jgi:hypothetical protein